MFNYIQGGFANPNTGGVRFIIGANTTTDTYSIWWDNGLSGTYTLLRENIALNLGGETDFVNVNALTFDPSGGLFLIDRIALGTDFNEIIAISGEDDGDGTDSDDLFLQYEFNEAEDTLASGAASIGSSQNTEALGDGYGSINGNGHLTTSADADRVNTSLVSDVFGGTIFYRIDFAGWDNAGANIATKFGFRLRSADTGNTQTNHLFEVSLNTGIGDNSANINTSASGSYSYVQGGMANPNTAGVSFILGVDTSTDTFSIWWDNGLTDSYTVLQENIALNLGGVTDFVSVNALTFDAGGAGVIIDRIAMDSDFLKISTFHIEDDGDDTDSVARIAELESQLAAVTAERDALPTQDAYDAVVAERDARLTEAQVRDARTGSVLFEVGAENNATISLVMEETGDLSDWDSGTTSSHDIAVTVPAGQDIRFYRFKIE